jgi:hypothetical protein
MSLLNTLTLITSDRKRTVSPILLRRNKLITKLEEQLQIALSKRDNTLYAPKRIKIYTDNNTGERKSIETTKRLREWYWTNEKGTISLSIRYGSYVLQLNKKGSNAIECMNTDELIETLKSLKIAVADGELDEAINSIKKVSRLSVK